MADWSQLPYDLIVLIANQLDSVEAFVNFSCVCRSWWFVNLNKIWNPSHLSPWLLLSAEDNKTRESTRWFYSLSRLKIYRVPSPEAAQGCRYWGSCHGWMVTINQDFEIFLVNPIEQVRIDLPSYSTLGDQVDHGAGWFGIIKSANVFKVHQDFVTVAVYGQRFNLAIARYKDCAWTSVINLPTSIQFIGAACFKDQILAVSMMGTLYLTIESGSGGSDSLRASYITSAPNDENGWENLYLVESLGKLLMVLLYAESENRCQMGFKVYSFDECTKNWRMLKDLGECALFVDDYSCISVRASGYIQRNRIYHARDNLGCLPYGCNIQHINVYNIEDGSLQNRDINVGYPAPYISPVWLLPSLRQGGKKRKRKLVY